MSCWPKFRGSRKGLVSLQHKQWSECLFGPEIFTWIYCELTSSVDEFNCVGGGIDNF